MPHEDFFMKEGEHISDPDMPEYEAKGYKKTCADKSEWFG